MSLERVRVKPDAIQAYGDTRGTSVYHRDPKTGRLTNSDGDQKNKKFIPVTPLKTAGVRAIDLYDRSMEPVWAEPTESRNSLEFVPDIKDEPYQSKYHTTYDPKTHYRFSDAYAKAIDDDPLVKQFLEDPKSEKKNAPPPPPGKPVASKQKLRPKRPKTVSFEDAPSDDEQKREFVKWVTNGKRDDLGQSERILFKNVA